MFDWESTLTFLYSNCNGGIAFFTISSSGNLYLTAVGLANLFPNFWGIIYKPCMESSLTLRFLLGVILRLSL